MKINIEQFNLSNTESKYCPYDRQNNALPHPQDIHFLIPRTREYVLLGGKRQLNLQVELNLLNS